MRVGRSARRGEGIRELAHRCEAPMRGGKMRRVLTWPWALGKSDRGLDVLLDRSEGAGITQRAGVGHWDGGAAERADGVPAGAAAAVGARAWAVARGRGPAMPQFIRVTFAVGCLSLVCLLALSSRISDGGGGAVGLLRGRDVGARARGGDPSQGWAASGILSNLRSRRGGIDGGDDLLETAGRHWDQRLARIGAVDSFVEVMRAGTGVRLDMALNVSLWEDSGVVYNDPRRPRGRYARGRGTGGDGGGQLEEEIDGSDMEAAGAFTTTTYKPPSVPAAISSAGGLLLDRSGAAARCPTGHIRVMIAVVSRCCGSLAFTNRDAIRKTWMAGVNSEYPDYMDARFFVAQPPNPKQYTESYNALRGEIKMYNDIVVLPGKEDYLELPRKSLQVLQYAVESPCNYTHVLKIDDDCYLRGDNLMKMIGEGHKQKDGIPSEVPWMHEMYAGQLQGAWEGEWMGFYPDRNPKSKWYLTEEELPDDVAPIGMTYLLGWGYLMSRDMAEHAVQRAANYTVNPEGRPKWWALLPWEDTVVGALLADRVEWHNHWGFKSAWNGCSTDTIVKHLDIDAPEYQYRLHHDEVSGKWSNSTVPCSTGEGEFEIDDYDGWRVWRDSLPDVAWAEV